MMGTLPKFVLLWTDAVVLLLAAALVAYGMARAQECESSP